MLQRAPPGLQRPRAGWPAQWLAADFAASAAGAASALRRDGTLRLSRFLTPAAVEYLQAEVDAILARKVAAVHPEWVMSPVQLLPGDNNWAWAIATQPPLLDLVRAQLVREPPAPWPLASATQCTLSLFRLGTRCGALLLAAGLQGAGPGHGGAVVGP